MPPDEDWNQLIEYLGEEKIAGGEMKEAGTAHWNSPNRGATNRSGFTALPGGFRFYKDTVLEEWPFDALGRWGYYWSASEAGSFIAWLRCLPYNSSKISRTAIDKEVGLSVSCVRDKATGIKLRQEFSELLSLLREH